MYRYKFKMSKFHANKNTVTFGNFIAKKHFCYRHFGYLSNQKYITYITMIGTKLYSNRHPVTSVVLLSKTSRQVAFDLSLNFSSSSPGTLKIIPIIITLFEHLYTV